MPLALPAYSFVSKEFMHYHAYVTGTYLPCGSDNLSAVPVGCIPGICIHAHAKLRADTGLSAESLKQYGIES